MASLHPERREVKIKIALAGVPFVGKEEMLRDMAAKFGQNDFQTTLVGDSRILSTVLSHQVPDRPDWRFKLGLHTVAGQADYNAITELLLENLGGMVFVCPIQSRGAAELRESLNTTLFNLRRRGRDLERLPVVMHYREQEHLPDFDISQLEHFLGIGHDALPSFHTALGVGNNLSDGILSVLLSVLDKVDFGEKDAA